MTDPSHGGRAAVRRCSHWAAGESVCCLTKGEMDH